ncbi:MAG: PHP domain-containing protein [Anaerolineae bacterium]|nr:PHP domain-containing protein [Anaerolineae bacterium]
MHSQTFHLSLTRQDQQRDPYPLLPFDVPEGTARITVEYTFEKGALTSPQDKNEIDLGLFDPRGHHFLNAPGFRGWSGGARSTVFVAADEATPGYLPGPLQPGQWHVLLGLYKIAPNGCTVVVTITLEPGDNTSTGHAPPIWPGALRDHRGWYCGDLHCHTHHSDAAGSVDDLIAAARAQGLDFLAVTDHNTVSHLPELARRGSPDLLLIPGMEITTYHGHANVWGLREWIDFRATDDAAMRRIRDYVRALGLLFSINHPKYEGPEWQFADVFDADAVEAWQAPWWFSNFESLAFWDGLLRQGKRIALVGGSDKHQKPFIGEMTAYEIGAPTTWVCAESLSERAVLDGIGAGHVFVTQSPRGPRLEFTTSAGGQTAMMGDDLRLSPGDEIAFTCRVWGGASCGERGSALRIVHRTGEWAQIPVDADEWSHTWTVAAQEADFWRVEVIEPTQVPLDKDPSAVWAYALSNPIYLRV